MKMLGATLIVFNIYLPLNNASAAVMYRPPQIIESKLPLSGFWTC